RAEARRAAGRRANRAKGGRNGCAAAAGAKESGPWGIPPQAANELPRPGRLAHARRPVHSPHREDRIFLSASNLRWHWAGKFPFPAAGGERGRVAKRWG